jgi:hypothetical protein
MEATIKVSAALLQLALAVTFLAIPVSRILGAPTLREVLALGVPMWLVWMANAVELGGAVLLLVGLRLELAAAAGALLIAASMAGATLAHLRAGNLFAEVPWTLVLLGLCLAVVALHPPALRLAVALAAERVRGGSQ